MVRGMLPVMLLGFDFFKKTNTVIVSAAIVGFVVFGIGFYAIYTIKETHNIEMDFVE
jgi:hypothetical protein